jgi:hypothetical protein
VGQFFLENAGIVKTTMISRTTLVITFPSCGSRSTLRSLRRYVSVVVLGPAVTSKSGRPKRRTGSVAGHWSVRISITGDNCNPLVLESGFTILSDEKGLVYDQPALRVMSSAH